MTNELKPCPFCGSEAHIYRHPTTGDYAPACNNDRCEVYWQREYGTEEQAIAAWNDRAERTCRWKPADFITEGEWWNTECGELFTWEPDGTPNHCPNCGAKVVEE